MKCAPLHDDPGVQRWNRDRHTVVDPQTADVRGIMGSRSTSEHSPATPLSQPAKPSIVSRVVSPLKPRTRVLPQESLVTPDNTPTPPSLSTLTEAELSAKRTALIRELVRIEDELERRARSLQKISQAHPQSHGTASVAAGRCASQSSAPLTAGLPRNHPASGPPSPIHRPRLEDFLSSSTECGATSLLDVFTSMQGASATPPTPSLHGRLEDDNMYPPHHQLLLEELLAMRERRLRGRTRDR